MLTSGNAAATSLRVSTWIMWALLSLSSTACCVYVVLVVVDEWPEGRLDTILITGLAASTTVAVVIRCTCLVLLRLAEAQAGRMLDVREAPTLHLPSPRVVGSAAVVPQAGEGYARGYLDGVTARGDDQQATVIPFRRT